MKRKKREGPARKVRTRNIAKKIIIASFVFLLIAAFFYLRNILRNLDYFRVKDVVVNAEGSGDFSYFKGRNIFDIDITKEAEYIYQAYPGYKRIKVIRVLPNRIFIDFVKRRPMAVLKLYRPFSIDEELVLFETGKESLASELPLIIGLETKIFGPKSGTRYSIKELSRAMEIIKFIQNNRAFRDYKIKTIEVHNASYLSCFISIPWALYGNAGKELASGADILQVKFSQEGLEGKLDLLARLFGQIRNDLNRISYIDLRFKEPVIKYKDDKK
jgi:cell division septal protein FtsQ